MKESGAGRKEEYSWSRAPSHGDTGVVAANSSSLQLQVLELMPICICDGRLRRELRPPSTPAASRHNAHAAEARLANRGEHYEVGRFSAWRSIYVVFCYDLRGGGVSLPVCPLSVITPSAGTLRLRMMGVAKAPIRRATMSPSRRSSPSRRRSSPPRPKPAKRDSTAKPLLPSSPPPPPKAVAQMPQADTPLPAAERDTGAAASTTTTTTTTAPPPLRRLSVTIAVLMAVVAWAAVLLAAHQSDLLPNLRVRSPPPLKRLLRSPRAPPMPPPVPEDDDDHEILCDCAWTRYPGQSCKETRGRDGFPCWQDCCAQNRE